MSILALDASTKSTGYAIFNNAELVSYGCITDNSTILMKRIKHMVDDIDKILEQHKEITKIYLEEVRPEETHGYANTKTYKALMYLQGCLSMMLYLKHPKIKIEYLYPSEWRKKCGIHTGRGIKRDTLKKADIDFVQKTFGITVNDDIADAIGIGYAVYNNDEQILC